LTLTENTKLTLDNGRTITLRTVSAADDEFLLSVYYSTREEELAQATWEPEQKDFFVRWQFGLQRREYDSRFPQAEYDVILVDDKPAGRIWIGTDDDEIRLLDIALLPEFQNQGVGTRLLGLLIEEATRANKRLRHMVFVHNNDAHRFYERLGFSVIEDLGAYKHMEFHV
jgi:ribosomal protein S18 acetylase RimI-like enzyme